MVSVIQRGSTASSHETHGADHGLSTGDACSQIEKESRLGEPQLDLPVQTKQLHRLAQLLALCMLCKTCSMTRNNL